MFVHSFRPLPRFVGLGGTTRGSMTDPFGSQPMGSYLLPIDTYGLSLTVLELFIWLQKRLRPTVRQPRI